MKLLSVILFILFAATLTAQQTYLGDMCTITAWNDPTVGSFVQDSFEITFEDYTIQLEGETLTIENGKITIEVENEEKLVLNSLENIKLDKRDFYSYHLKTLTVGNFYDIFANGIEKVELVIEGKSYKPSGLVLYHSNGKSKYYSFHSQMKS